LLFLHAVRKPTQNNKPKRKVDEQRQVKRKKKTTREQNTQNPPAMPIKFLQITRKSTFEKKEIKRI
jgi:hypothetical protein